MLFFGLTGVGSALAFMAFTVPVWVSEKIFLEKEEKFKKRKGGKNEISEISDKRRI